MGDPIYGAVTSLDSQTPRRSQSPPRTLLRRGRDRLHRSSLAAKFNLVFVTLLIVNVVGVGGWLTSRIAAGEREALRQRGFELVEMFEPGTPLALYEQDRTALDAAVDRLSQHPDVAYARVLNAHGQLLAERVRVSGIRPPPAELHATFDENAASATSRLDDAGNPLSLDIVLPITALDENGDLGELAAVVPAGSELPRVLGYLQAGLNSQRQLATLRANTQWGAAVSLLVALLGSLTAVAMTRRMAAPIRELAAVTRAMSDGDFDQSVELRRSDEIGELAEALNATLARLR